jgi:predicted AAA+ superfamily ATPase
VEDALAARLRVMPAAVVTGARQTGKSTLVEHLVPGRRRYRSLDDFDVRDAARRDPEALPGGDVGLPQPTVRRWLNLLETSYLLVRLPAYAVNRTKRLVKSPRVFWGDTGAHRVGLAYWRTTIGEEVDFVIEAGGELLPIEVKATSKPRLADCAHLRTFRQEYGRKARAGLLLHTGQTVEWLTPDVPAVPWWRVL